MAVDSGASGSRSASGPAPSVPVTASSARPPGSRAPITGLVAVLLALLSWPVRTIAPLTDIDASWQAGMHIGVPQGLVHGRDLIFTHGPLAFLVSPQLYVRPTAALAWLFIFLAQVAFCAVLLVMLRRHLPLPLAALVTAGLTLVVVRPAPDLLALVVLLLALDLLQSRVPLRHPRAWWAAAVLTVVVVALAKISSGIYALAVTGLLVAALAPGSGVRRVPAAALRLLATGAAVAVVLVVVWVAIGQPLGALPPWLRGSVEVSLGYTDGMALEEPGRGWEYLAAAGLVAGLVALMAVGWRSPRRVAVVLLLLGVGYLEFKRGFVIHNRHSLGFFLFLVALPVAVRLTSWRARVPALALSGLAVLALAAAADVDPAPGDPLVRATRAAEQVRTLASADRSAAVMQAGREQAVAELALPPEVVSALDGRSVHVEPWDLIAVWAYRLDWRPLPVLQTYSAYTPWLDDANAAALADDRAPDVLLRARRDSLLRSPAFDQPLVTLAQTCRYAETVLTDRWQVIERGGQRCGAPRELATVQVAAGEPVAVPAPADPTSLVAVRLDTPSSPGRALRALAFKAPPLHVVLDDRRERLIEGHRGSPYLLRVPPGGPAGPGPGGRLDVAELTLPDTPGPATVTFLEIPYQPGPAAVPAP